MALLEQGLDTWRGVAASDVPIKYDGRSAIYDYGAQQDVFTDLMMMARRRKLKGFVVGYPLFRGKETPHC